MLNLDKELHEKFIEVIKMKIPDGANLANMLADVLAIKKEAIYRRLRGDVFFTFAETVSISRHFGISIDEVSCLVSPYRSHLFMLHVLDYNNMEDVDYRMSTDYITAIRAASSDAYSEYGFATTILPMHFSLFHAPFYYLYILKWMYMFGYPGQIPSYAEIKFSERQQKINQQYLHEIMLVKYTYYIWDNLFLAHLINDINYFHSIRLLSGQDVALLQKEIAYFLNRLEKLAVDGCYGNGNRVDIYVSNLNFETTYSYLSSDHIHVSMISSYIVGALTSLEKGVNDDMKQWMQAYKRTSSLISCSAEKERILFFETQRNMLDQSLVISNA